MRLQAHSTFIKIVGALTLVMMLACQLIPLAQSEMGGDIIELCDFDDGEEKDVEEKEVKKLTSSIAGKSHVADRTAASIIDLTNAAPVPPYMEVPSPPPDLV